jgi:hypothetical protein
MLMCRPSAQQAQGDTLNDTKLITGALLATMLVCGLVRGYVTALTVHSLQQWLQLGDAYHRGYAKTSYGVCEIKKNI